VVGGLTWPESVRSVWGWVRLHTSGALLNQGTQVKPAISTHAQESASYVPSALAFILRVYNLYDKPNYSPSYLCPLEAPQKSHVSGACSSRCATLVPNVRLSKEKEDTGRTVNNPSYCRAEQMVRS